MTTPTDPTTLRTALEALIADGIEAFRLTREYVGDDVLPDEPGWSWFDWAQRARAALATPAPAADEARCGHRNISFSEVGCVDCGRLLERDTVMTDAPQVMHTNPAPTPAPPTPPATEPVAALVSELVGDLRLSELGRDGRLDIVARKLDAIVAAARAEVDVEALAEALDGLPYRDCEMWVNNDIPTAGFAHDLADAYLAARARRAGESRA